MQVAFTKMEPPQWLLDMWKEIDDKTFGKGFDCFTDDAVCNLAAWRIGRVAKQFTPTLRPSSIPDSPRGIASPNIGMQAF